MLGTKPKHARDTVTFNVNSASTSYRKEEHWIDRYDDNPLDLALTITYGENSFSSCSSQVSNALHTPIDQV